jgi:hypothetical protein
MLTSVIHTQIKNTQTVKNKHGNASKEANSAKTLRYCNTKYIR